MPKESLKHQAYQIIKEKIIDCTYAPGAIINEELIREEINASRTPIRDALSRLEQEGLLKIMPKKGIVISEITVNDINMIYEARCLVEPHVVRQYGSRIPQKTLMHYYHMYIDYIEGKIDHYSYQEMDDSFHRLFINASENSFFINLYSSIESQILRTRVISGKVSSPRLSDTAQEHIAIVKAALKNDWIDASKAMENHLSLSKNTMFDYIFKKELEKES